MIEENSTGGMQPVGFAIVYSEPVTVHLRTSIRTAWPKGSGLSLRNFLDFAKHFGRACLIESGFLQQTGDPNSL